MEIGLEPLLALGLVVLLGVVGRWVFGTGRGRRDYGLLVPVVTTTAGRDAEAARQRLATAGIRSTLGEAPRTAYVDAKGFATVRPAGRLVLVFPDDLERARLVLHP